MTQTEKPYDPLLECLVAFSERYSRPLSIDSLVAGLPIEPGEAGPELFSLETSKGLFQRAAQRAGFSSRLIKRDISELSSHLLPCIVVLADRKACIVEEIDVDAGEALVIYPEDSQLVMSLALSELQRLSMGYAFLLKKQVPRLGRSQILKQANIEHWFWDTLRLSKDAFGGVVLASLLINLFVVATPLFVMNVYDRVVPNDAFETLWVLAFGVFAVFCFDALLRYIRVVFLETAGKKSDVIMSSILYEHVLNLRLESWPRSVGAFASNLREFESIRSFFTASTISAMVDMPFSLLLLLLIGFIAGPLVFAPLIIIALLLVHSYFIAKPLKKSIEDTQEAASEKNAHLVESLHAIQTIKSLGAASHSQWIWEESTGEIAQKSIRSRMLSSSITVVSQFLIQLNTIVIVTAGVYLISSQSLSLGGLIAVVMLSSRAVAPMAQVAALITQYEQTKAAFATLDEIMMLPGERDERRQYVRRPSFKGNIEIQDVCFNYPGTDVQSLRSLKLSVKAGERVGIIGKVGSGKSSLAKLLIGLYQPTEGSILIDGINSAQIDPADTRSHIAFLSQEPQLMRGSIRENLCYRNPRVSDDQMLKVAQISGVDQFVGQLSGGYDTQVGEQGLWLSGGQRQAIALGRAILLDEPIVVLDEPTSHMDNATEQYVKRQLYHYTRDKTLIVITHKLSLLDLVDRLIVMEAGQVLLDGPKAEVIEAIKKMGK